MARRKIFIYDFLQKKIYIYLYISTWVEHVISSARDKSKSKWYFRGHTWKFSRRPIGKRKVSLSNFLSLPTWRLLRPVDWNGNWSRSLRGSSSWKFTSLNGYLAWTVDFHENIAPLRLTFGHLWFYGKYFGTFRKHLRSTQ